MSLLVLQLILLSLTIEQIAHYLTASTILEPMRLKIATLEREALTELVFCHECCSFWVSLLLVLFVQPLNGFIWNGIAVFALLPLAQIVTLIRFKLQPEDPSGEIPYA